jgi:hypothetical protein
MFLKPRSRTSARVTVQTFATISDERCCFGSRRIASFAIGLILQSSMEITGYSIPDIPSRGNMKIFQ